jgi:hypothetical protein
MQRRRQPADMCRLPPPRTGGKAHRLDKKKMGRKK